MTRTENVYSTGLWRSRGYIPHYDGTTYQFITFRLADALPMRIYSAIWEQSQSIDPELREQFRRSKIEKFLDEGFGACWLENLDCAVIVQQALQFFDGERYDLIEWVIMPNHVHVLIRLHVGWTLDRLVHSWKSFTANEIAKILGTQGRLWQRDYWDRYIRDEAHYNATMFYIRNNPVKAGLVEKQSEFRFSSAFCGEEWPFGPRIFCRLEAVPGSVGDGSRI